MKPRLRALCAGLGVWGLALAVPAEEAPASAAESEPSLAVFQQLDARTQLSHEQRAFFGPYFEAHANQLRDMKRRLNRGELSYVGAMLEGRALRRELDAEAIARLDDVQRVALGEIRNAFRGEFRALFLKEEDAWLLRLFGQSVGVTTSPDAVASASGEKS